MADAVHYFVPNNPVVARTLRQKLAARVAELSEQLGSGSAQDWADYNRKVGCIWGLTDAIAECERVEKDMEN